MKGGFAVGAGSESSSNGCDQGARAAISTRVFYSILGSKGGTRISGWKFQEGRFQIKRETFKRWSKLPFEVMFSLLWNHLA